MPSDGYDPKRATGYTLAQLAEAFDRIRNPRDWKAPVLAVIPEGERPVVEQAIRWFTATAPVFEVAAGLPDRLVVTAPGYELGRPYDSERVIWAASRDQDENTA
jgi:hypothetical protein